MERTSFGDGLSVNVLAWSVPLKCTKRTVLTSIPYSEDGAVKLPVNLAVP